jgi:hypothetical protein
MLTTLRWTYLSPTHPGELFQTSPHLPFSLSKPRIRLDSREGNKFPSHFSVSQSQCYPSAHVLVILREDSPLLAFPRFPTAAAADPHLSSNFSTAPLANWSSSSSSKGPRRTTFDNAADRTCGTAELEVIGLLAPGGGMGEYCRSAHGPCRRVG